jgi:hypothetical protein
MLGDALQGAAVDCNSAEVTHAWFDSRVAHHILSEILDRRIAFHAVWPPAADVMRKAIPAPYASHTPRLPCPGSLS